jgi:pyruvate,water dikinase
MFAWLDHGECLEPALIGGKGANLCRLASTHPVPPAFCLTVAAYDLWAATPPEAAADVFPAELYPQLISAYTSLAERLGLAAPSVAVRSSAADEDGATSSFAGLHDTYLNVVGSESVAGAIVNCWLSARSPRALAYRRRRGLAVDQIRMAVVVQQLVPADVSVVAFSAHPVTGERGEVLINATWGLGESLVSGTVTPDAYVINKTDLAVRSRHIGAKASMTILAPGGTTEVPVPPALRNQTSLSDAQLGEVARLALALEHHMGRPVDVECAYQGAELVLLQCRPITSFSQ